MIEQGSGGRLQVPLVVNRTIIGFFEQADANAFTAKVRCNMPGCDWESPPCTPWRPNMILESHELGLHFRNTHPVLNQMICQVAVATGELAGPEPHFKR